MILPIFTRKDKDIDRYMSHMRRALARIHIPESAPIAHSIDSDDMLRCRADLSNRLRESLGLSVSQSLWCAEAIVVKFSGLPFSRLHVRLSCHWLFSERTIDRTIALMRERGVLRCSDRAPGSHRDHFEVTPSDSWGVQRISSRRASKQRDHAALGEVRITP